LFGRPISGVTACVESEDVMPRARWRIELLGATEPPQEFLSQDKAYRHGRELVAAGETVRVMRWNKARQWWEWHTTLSPSGEVGVKS
jgi:hypothetical protein